MIKCVKCGLDKELDCYYMRSNGKPNSRTCKECTKIKVRENLKKVGNAYDFSEKGVFRVIYKNQKRHQKLRGHGDMPYTKQELVVWCKENGFNGLYSEWVESGHLKDLKPSVDRLDDLKGYSLDNIRLVTWKENRRHQYSDIESGKGSSGKRCKAVLKLDSNGNTICEYVSFNAAKRDVGYHMEYPIKNGTKCKMGFFWKYK